MGPARRRPSRTAARTRRPSYERRDHGWRERDGLRRRRGPASHERRDTSARERLCDARVEPNDIAARQKRPISAREEELLAKIAMPAE